MSGRELSCQKGYTLAELLVVMVIFGIVLSITATSFNRIVSGSGQTVRLAETEIEGIIGLEVLRSDLALAGFGLPWSFQNPALIGYPEASSGVAVKGYPGTDPSLYNDLKRPPRAITSGDNVGYNGSDYLVLKGSALGMTRSCRKWIYLTYTSSGAVVKACKDPDRELKVGGGETVIALNSAVRGGIATKELVMDGSGYFFSFSQGVTASTNPFRPRSFADSYLVYGIADPDKSGAPYLAAPFNRSDYYLERPSDISTRCAPHTAVLYKGVLEQRLGQFKGYPLLDCVADFQVIYGFSQDSNLNGKPDLHQDQVLHPDGGPADAQDIRDQVREVRVYILAQEGKWDPAYHYPTPTVTVERGRYYGRQRGEPFDLSTVIGPGYEHYRWKVYRIVVEPKNLE